MRSLGTWWEQKVLMGYWWEEEEFVENCLETWWKSKGPPQPLQNKKHPLGARWPHPIGSPRMFYPKVVFSDKLLGEVLPMYGIVFNKLRRERKLDGPAKKDYVVHVHILFACLPFCQRISRSRQAEPRSSQSCARPICLHLLTFSSHYGWPLSTHILSASLFLKLLHFSIGFLCVSSSLNPWQAKNGFSGMLSWFIKLNSFTQKFSGPFRVWS